MSYGEIVMQVRDMEDPHDAASSVTYYAKLSESPEHTCITSIKTFLSQTEYLKDIYMHLGKSIKLRQNGIRISQPAYSSRAGCIRTMSIQVGNSKSRMRVDIRTYVELRILNVLMYDPNKPFGGGHDDKIEMSPDGANQLENLIQGRIGAQY